MSAAQRAAYNGLRLRRCARHDASSLSTTPAASAPSSQTPDHRPPPLLQTQTLATRTRRRRPIVWSAVDPDRGVATEGASGRRSAGPPRQPSYSEQFTAIQGNLQMISESMLTTNAERLLYSVVTFIHSLHSFVKRYIISIIIRLFFIHSFIHSIHSYIRQNEDE